MGSHKSSTEDYTEGEELYLTDFRVFVSDVRTKRGLKLIFRTRGKCLILKSLFSFLFHYIDFDSVTKQAEV